MKKWLAGSLLVLGVNFVVLGLVGTAFFVLATRWDFVLAAIPAIVALPAILLQPWMVLFLLFPIPGMWMFTPVWTTAVTIPVYAWLDRAGRFERAKRVLFHLPGRKLARLGVAALLCGSALGYFRYIDFPALRHGVPRTLQYAVKGLDVVFGNPQHYRLGAFIDAEWLVRARLAGPDLDRLAGKLGLRPMDGKQIDPAFFNMPPYWWHPVVSGPTRVLATAGFPKTGRGADGWHALAVWNPDDQLLYLWIKDNF